MRGLFKYLKSEFVIFFYHEDEIMFLFYQGYFPLTKYRFHFLKYNGLFT